MDEPWHDPAAWHRLCASAYVTSCALQHLVATLTPGELPNDVLDALVDQLTRLEALLLEVQRQLRFKDN